jgi:hypothetical protein
MKLRELDSFRLSDAVKFHDTLNPVLFDDDHMDPAVRQQLLEIAQDFIEHLGISKLEVNDIRISGSNAAYTYTQHSDIDLHIIVDIGALDNDEVYRELFTAKKTVYNDSHDITVRGYDVELYVEDSKQPVKSLGEYSVLKNKWIKHPVKRRANFDEVSTRSKFTKLVQLAQLALESSDLDKIQLLLDTIKKYRMAGLEENGEFGPENLAYKALRTRGIVDKLYKHRDNLHDRNLSLHENSKFSNLKQLKNSIQQLPTWNDYVSDPKSWWRYRDKITDILFDMEKIKLLQPILTESMRRLKKSRVLGENYDFPKNDTRCLSDLISFINTEQVFPSDLKKGQTVDLVRIYTLNYAKLLNLEIHRGVMVDKIINDNTVLVHGDNNLHRIVVNKIQTDADTLDAGYYSFFLDTDKLISGLFFYKDQIEKNEWSVELEDTKLSEDYHPNDTPRGTEFKPTMPAGTVKVDVSDVYDWYKLGQHISNLDGLGKHDFGKGPPSTIMAFGSEDAEHKYIDALKKTGLNTTDIDPVDPKQPKGMKRQKTDPTYNVAEGLAKINSDKKPKLSGLSFDDLDRLSESAGSNFSKFDSAIKRNLNLPKWTNTVELYGVYARKLSESKSGRILLENELSDIEQKLFNELTQRSVGSIDSAKVGDKVSLLHMITLNIPGHKVVAKLNGFLAPKEIAKITKSGTFQQLEFKDGSKYPEKDGGDIFQQTQTWNMTKLFPSYETAEKAYLLYALVGKKLSKELDFQSSVEQSIAEGLDAEAYKQKLLSSLPQMMQFFAKNVEGWKPSREQMLAAVETGYTVMKHTGDVQQAGRAMMDELNSLHRMSQGKKNTNESSGYIPSEKEKDDPRFKTALTVDVKPDSIKKNAKAFGFKVSRAGIPPLLRK